jgi:hypothetical protein
MYPRLPSIIAPVRPNARARDDDWCAKDGSLGLAWISQPAEKLVEEAVGYGVYAVGREGGRVQPDGGELRRSRVP